MFTPPVPPGPDPPVAATTAAAAAALAGKPPESAVSRAILTGTPANVARTDIHTAHHTPRPAHPQPTSPPTSPRNHKYPRLGQVPRPQVAPEGNKAANKSHKKGQTTHRKTSGGKWRTSHCSVCNIGVKLKEKAPLTRRNSRNDATIRRVWNAGASAPACKTHPRIYQHPHATSRILVG